MATANVIINNVQYNDVPSILLPKVGGGTAEFSLGGGGGGISIDDLATNTAPSGAITLGSSVTSIGNYAFAGKPITSIIAPNATYIGEHCLDNTQITDITDANFPLLGVNSRFMILLRFSQLQHIKLTGAQLTLHSGSGALRDMGNLVSVELPNCAKNVGLSYLGMGNACFYGDSKLELVDMGFCQSVGNTGFYNCRKLQTLIMRRTSVVPLANTNAFINTPFRGYSGLTGTIYIPKVLYDHLGDGSSSDYQQATNWSTLYADGHCVFAQIEGSQYE